MKKLLVVAFFLLGISGGMYIMTSTLDGVRGYPKSRQNEVRFCYETREQNVKKYENLADFKVDSP